MKIPDPIAVDFETHAIQSRPLYPPKPVGCSVILPGKKPEYFAWGHPTENNCTETFARKQLLAIYKTAAKGDGVVFHNGKFDADVGETHLGLPMLAEDKIHDTLFLAFLHDPHSKNLSLKPLAERHLKIPAKERDKLRDWIMLNIKEAKQSSWGAHISKAPGGLVGQYAKMDTAMTKPLFKKLYADIASRNMLEAYRREQQLMPILLGTEREGLCVNLPKLRRDVAVYGGVQNGVDDDGDIVYKGGVLNDIDAMIRKRLNAPGLKISKAAQLAEALHKAGVMSSWKTTPTGKLSTAKDALIEGISDNKLVALLLYRSSLATTLQTFMRPWLVLALNNNGRIHTTWNQVRQSHGEESLVGARTGRLSSSPNFQNIPTESSPNFELLMAALIKARLLDKLPKFPTARSYLAPDPGEYFINRDYSQQELRILGHYEGAVLMDRYNEDPWLDVHELAQKLINDMLGTNFSRKPIKNTGFGLIYGMGTEKLAVKTGQDIKTAKFVKNAYLEIFPGLGTLTKELKACAARGEPIRTWGGREYFVEPPAYSKAFARWMTFDYKLLNQLIQGSAADNTKQAIINYHHHPKRTARFLLTVHDEFLGSTAKAVMKTQMLVMQEAMHDVKFDVPMLSEGSFGVDWSNLKTFDEKGKVIYRGK